MQCLTLVHTIACIVGCAIARAITFLNRAWLVSHWLSNRWLSGNPGWLLSLDIVVVLAAIHSVSVIRHRLRGCALFVVIVQRFRSITGA